MTYFDAKLLVGKQERNLKKINGVRFVEGGYEYRLSWYGGFACYVAVDRRKVGKRKFEYFSGVSAVHCWSVGQVMDLVMDEVRKVA